MGYLFQNYSAHESILTKKKPLSRRNFKRTYLLAAVSGKNFPPGNPVPTELFVGRSEQIEQLLNYIGQIVTGKQENIFL
jgi:hypothetical protein